ncbi:MAG TPA: redoxin domain-containing protein [Puia sp.]|nr:redoxin domain-containing protein [Puia sp.]
MSTATISPGQQAPDFSLYDSDKQKVNLSDLRGRNVLLLFFPQAFTGTCTKELCSTRDNIGLYNDTNARVLGISVDSIFTLARYKEDQHLNFSLLSDFNKETSAAYGTLYDTFAFDMKGVSKRSAFVIDKNGVVRYAEVLEKASDLPDFDAIQKTLRELN